MCIRDSVRLNWADSGPDHDEIFVGYTAMQRFWEILERNCGFQAQLPAHSAYEFSRTRAVPGGVVSGLMQICADEGSNMLVEVAARQPGDGDDYFRAVGQEAGREAKLTPYRFVASKHMELEYVVGQRWTHGHLGREEIVNDYGKALSGAYGVMHSVCISIHNPTDGDARVQVIVRAGGGPARMVARIDGRLSHTGLLTPAAEQVLAERVVAAGASRTIRIRMMPGAGSNMPLSLTVRARP